MRGPFQSGMVQVAFVLDKIVGLMTESSAIATVPGRGAQKSPHMTEAPAGFLLDLSRERSRKVTPGSTWPPMMSQVSGKDATVRASLVGEEFTSKIHLSAGGRCRPLSFVVTAGQQADCTRFKLVLDKIRVLQLGRSGPCKRPDSLAADRTYSIGPCRDYPWRRGIRHTIPDTTGSNGRAIGSSTLAP
ncbi:hypothetical protein GCM10010211_65580 [Streptomyces albospinus]|uniref:Transposase n=1 Tax=Streptomyces albospinus TaxID=285515 RepID=A0ABQ2VKN8_9ACTN|nr:hypothetical protein GCM10010211_65580 [Streptomyces albospinus]